MQLKIPTYCLPILLLFALFYPHREHRAVLVEKSSPKLLTGLLLVPTVSTITFLVASICKGPTNLFERAMVCLFFLATACLLCLIYLTLQRDGNLPAKHTAYLLLLLPMVAVIVPFLVFVVTKAWIKGKTKNELDRKFLGLTLLTGFSIVCIILYVFILRRLVDKKMA